VSDDIEAVIRELMMTYGPAAAVRLLREPAELPADAAIARKVKAAASNLAHAQRAGDWGRGSSRQRLARHPRRSHRRLRETKS
jgi:hypothetical protein